MKQLFIILASLAFLTAFADDHAPVNSRNLPDEKKQIQEEIIQKEFAAEAASEPTEEAEFQTRVSNDTSVFSPYSCHSLSSVSTAGDTLVLEDGSTWVLSQYNSSIVMTWKKSDPLFIYPNRSWFSYHKYKIVNQATGASIPVTRTKGPIINGDFSLQIVTIDFAKGQVYLNDDSIWYINSSDLYLLEEWRAGDYIIIGHDNSWFGSSKYILLNSNMYNHVRANNLN